MSLAQWMPIAVCLAFVSTTSFAAQNDSANYSKRAFTPQTGKQVVSPVVKPKPTDAAAKPVSQTNGQFAPGTDSKIKLRKASWHSSNGQPAENTKSEKRTVPGSSSSLWTTFGTLALMIVGILIVARLAKRKTGLSSQTIPTEAMEILGRKTVDPQNGIYLIRCGSRILMLGASENGLRTLCEITDPLEIDYLSGMCRTDVSEAGSSISFQSLFRRQSSNNPEPTRSAAANESTTNDENLKNRLLQMLNKRGGAA